MLKPPLPMMLQLSRPHSIYSFWPQISPCFQSELKTTCEEKPLKPWQKAIASPSTYNIWRQRANKQRIELLPWATSTW